MVKPILINGINKRPMVLVTSTTISNGNVGTVCLFYGHINEWLSVVRKQLLFFILSLFFFDSYSMCDGLKKPLCKLNMCIFSKERQRNVPFLDFAPSNMTILSTFQMLWSHFRSVCVCVFMFSFSWLHFVYIWIYDL